jgi:hypothetical protein
MPFVQYMLLTDLTLLGIKVDCGFVLSFVP